MSRLQIAVVIVVLSISGTDARAEHADCLELHAAAYMDEPGELIDSIRHGADIECRDAIYQTPLITATDGASFSVFSILLARGADIHARDEIGETALDKARKKLAFFDIQGGEIYYDIYQRMIEMLIAASANR